MFYSVIRDYMAIANLLIDIDVLIILQISKGVIVWNPILCLIFISYESKNVVRGPIRWPT